MIQHKPLTRGFAHVTRNDFHHVNRIMVIDFVVATHSLLLPNSLLPFLPCIIEYQLVLAVAKIMSSIE